ncbi:hypothetical protein ACOMHN_018213 [Nucella lapillus]
MSGKSGAAGDSRSKRRTQDAARINNAKRYWKAQEHTDSIEEDVDDDFNLLGHQTIFLVPKNHIRPLLQHAPIRDRDSTRGIYHRK